MYTEEYLVLYLRQHSVLFADGVMEPILSSRSQFDHAVQTTLSLISAVVTSSHYFAKGSSSAQVEPEIRFAERFLRFIRTCINPINYRRFLLLGLVSISIRNVWCNFAFLIYIGETALDHIYTFITVSCHSFLSYSLHRTLCKVCITSRKSLSNGNVISFSFSFSPSPSVFKKIKLFFS